MTALYKDANRPVSRTCGGFTGAYDAGGKVCTNALWLVLDEHGEHRERTDLSDEFAGVSARDSAGAAIKTGRRADNAPAGYAHCGGKKRRAANRLQKTLVEETRLGIPALFHEECPWDCCAKTPRCSRRR